MFEMDLPWWEFIVRAAMIYGALLVMMRVAGKRTVGQFSPFDLLVVMLLSESVSNSLSGGDSSVAGGLILAGTLIVLNMAMAWLTSHSRKAGRLIEGSAVLLGRDGRLFPEVVKKHRISDVEIEQALHEEDCPLEQTRCIFLETDGKITVLKKD